GQAALKRSSTTRVRTAATGAFYPVGPRDSRRPEGDPDVAPRPRAAKSTNVASGVSATDGSASTAWTRATARPPGHLRRSASAAKSAAPTPRGPQIAA